MKDNAWLVCLFVGINLNFKKSNRPSMMVLATSNNRRSFGDNNLKLLGLSILFQDYFGRRAMVAHTTIAGSHVIASEEHSS